MEIEIYNLSPSLIDQYIDFFEHRALPQGDPNEGCYCVWHHWTPENELARSLLPAQERASCKKNYAAQLIREGKLHGFAAVADGKIVGFCNADDKKTFYRLSPDERPSIWQDMPEDAKVLSLVCFTVSPEYRGHGIASKLLSFACQEAARQGYTCVEGYPSASPVFTGECVGPLSMYEKAGFAITPLSDGIVVRKFL